MKIKLIHQLSALICGLTLLPLMVSAQPINRATNIDLVTGGTYYSRTNNGVIVAINDGTAKTGTNNVLYSNVTGGMGLNIGGTGSAFSGKNLAIYTGIKLDTAGNALDADNQITSDPSKFVALNTAYANPGIMAVLGAYVEVDNLTMMVNASTNSENGAKGAEIAVATAIFRNVNITVNGGAYSRGMYVRSDSVLDIQSGTITVNNINETTKIGLDGQLGSYITATDLTLNVTGQTNQGAAVLSNQSTVILTDSIINADATLFQSQSGIITVTDVQAIGSADGILVSSGSNNSQVTIEGGSLAVDGNLIKAQGTAAGTVIMDGVDTVNGGDLINTSGSSALDVTFKAMDVSGGINTSGSSALDVTLNDSTLTGNIQNNGEGNLTLTGSNGSVITGDVTNNGDGTLNLGLNDSSLTGNINNNNGTISSTGSSSITGDVNSSLEVSSGTLTVTGSVTVDSGHSVTGNGTLTVGGLEINDGGTLGGGLTIGTNSTERILVGLGSATLYHEFGNTTETSTDTLKLGENIALDLSSIDDLSDFEFAFTDEVQDGNFTLILGETESLENWDAEINGNIEGLTLSGQNKVTADISITLTGEGSTLTATLSNVTVTAVPEPSTYILLGTGLGILLLAARRRKTCF